MNAAAPALCGACDEAPIYQQARCFPCLQRAKAGDYAHLDPSGDEERWQAREALKKSGGCRVPTCSRKSIRFGRCGPCITRATLAGCLGHDAENDPPADLPWSPPVALELVLDGQSQGRLAFAVIPSSGDRLDLDGGTARIIEIRHRPGPYPSAAVIAERTP